MRTARTFCAVAQGAVHYTPLHSILEHSLLTCALVPCSTHMWQHQPVDLEDVVCLPWHAAAAKVLQMPALLPGLRLGRMLEELHQVIERYVAGSCIPGHLCTSRGAHTATLRPERCSWCECVEMLLAETESSDHTLLLLRMRCTACTCS